jgi:large subunit ribosomal protein L18
MALTKSERRIRIKRRIRKNISGTAVRPRLSVFRSNKNIYAQLINDDDRVTILSVSSKDKGIIEKTDINKIQQAQLVGTTIGEKAKEAGVELVVFDRGGYLYHGRVKALAESARTAGLKF